MTDSHHSTVEVVPGQPVAGVIRPPGSKSLTNRAFVCAAFAESVQPSVLTGALDSEDTQVMTQALRQIGIQIESSAGGTTLSVQPKPQTNSADTGSRSDAATGASRQQELFIANSGTTVRFLSAALSAAGGRYRLHGVDRMHQRPIGDLIHSIAAVINGRIQTESPGGCPPVLIDSHGWKSGQLSVAGNVSSQYLSGLMMAAPLSGLTTRIEVVGELVSRPYINMTANVMRSFAARVQLDDSPSGGLIVMIDDAGYQPTHYAIEPDASAASYFWAAAAISRGSVIVEGLDRHAVQGDVGFVEVLRQMGCQIDYLTGAIRVTGGKLRGIDVDMNAISDTVQTLAVVALFADGPTRVRGVAHNRFKETDRIGDLATELRKLGATVIEHDDGMTIDPPTDFVTTDSSLVARNVVLETYHDHRMAMSLSLAGLRIAGIRISNPSCTSKTYPNYFADLESLIRRPHRWHSATATKGNPAN